MARRVKSLKYLVDDIGHGHVHREHRSKKGRRKLSHHEREYLIMFKQKKLEILTKELDNESF